MLRMNYSVNEAKLNISVYADNIDDKNMLTDAAYFAHRMNRRNLISVQANIFADIRYVINLIRLHIAGSFNTATVRLRPTDITSVAS